MKTKVIINPKAGGGQSEKLWPELSKQCLFLGPYDEVYTKAPQDMTKIVKEALKSGFEKILVVGGDGSLTEAVNGFFENDKPINGKAHLGTLPLGSGSDFLKTLGIFSVEKALGGLKKNRVLCCDIGEVSYQNKKGKTQNQLFLNIASFGCGGKIVEEVNQSKKTFGATLTYLAITAKTFLTYQNPKVHLEIEKKEKKDFVINNLFVCNGRYSGSGMCWGPKASLTDGLFDLTIIKDIPKLEGLLSMRKIYQGKVLEMGGVERMLCHEFSATSSSAVPLEVDGDTVGTLPVHFQIFPCKINIWY